jgi:N-acetylneuraminate synthase
MPHSSNHKPSTIVAEIAQAHDGSLGIAHTYIDAAADAGADGVKFQTHIASAESTQNEPWRVKFSQQDETRYEYWKRMEFSEEQWLGLKKHAKERNLLFISSPFSLEAVELLTRVGVDAWKIASGEVGSALMFDQITKTGLPIILSTGMSTLSEINAAVERIQAAGLPLTMLQCTSMYPTPPETVGLNLISFFRKEYGCSVGLSDHSGAIYSGLAAAAIGVDMLEVHVTFSREMFGPDVPASITLDELNQLVEGVRFIENVIAHPVDKDAIAEELIEMRNLFHKSVALRMDLPAGTVLAAKHLTTKKPGTGIPVEKASNLIGRKLISDVRADELLQESDLA